ncbi:AarF/UbiB family protein [Legionella sp. D16C41]|uniref:AarF/UbiB family protein n=1 Tax=Legionella sp. D16C41 TaxID=3402688 RepID=UPI003AF8E6F9
MTHSDKLLQQLIALNEEIQKQLPYKPNAVDREGHKLEDRLALEIYHLFLKELNQLGNTFLKSKEMNQSNLLLEITKKINNKINEIKIYLNNLNDPVSTSSITQKETEQLKLFNTRLLSLLELLNPESILKMLLSGESLQIINLNLNSVGHELAGLGEYRKNFSNVAKNANFIYLGNLNNEVNEKILTLSEGNYLEQTKAKYAQCGEHVALALYKIIEREILTYDDEVAQIQIDYPSGENHTFLVINLPLDATLDSKTWGEEAIFFDSWGNFVAKSHKDLYFFNGNYTITRYKRNDKELLDNLNKTAQLLAMTGNKDAKSLKQTLIEEHQLISLKDNNLAEPKELLLKLIEEVRPQYFTAPIKLFLTLTPTHLVTTLSGFSKPTLIVDANVFTNLTPEKLGELKFSLAVNLVYLETYGTGTIHKISAASQFELDKQAWEITKDNEAAIRFLRNEALYKVLKEDEAGLIIPSASQDMFSTTATIEQRIKNLMTFFAEKASIVKELNPGEDKKPTPNRHVTSLIQYEDLSSYQKLGNSSLCYQITFNDKSTTVDKINLLKEQLSSLKEQELLPYEMTTLPSRRVREFCQFVRRLTINWENSEEAAAIDDFITEAMQLRVPGFDRIYAALMQVDHDDFAYIIDRHQNYKPLGPFKQFYNAILTVTTSKDFNDIIAAATTYLELYPRLKNHFINENLRKYANEYLDQYRAEHQGSVPTGAARFFGSQVGTKINWPSFSNKNQFSNLIDIMIKEKKILPHCLWLMGVKTHPDVLNFMPRELIESELAANHYSTNLRCPPFLSQYYVDARNLKKDIAIYFSQKHQLNISMFEKDLDFETQFKQFIELNEDALRCPDSIDNLNCNNDAVNALLERFTIVALTGSTAEKEVVKSFFLGREDKKDLATLYLPYAHNLLARLNFDSPYFQFCFYQKFNETHFNLFTNEECIQLVKKFDRHHAIPLECLINYFNIPNILSLDNITLFFQKSKDNELELSYLDILQNFLQENKLQMISKDTAKLFQLIKNYYMFERDMELLTEISWTCPSQDRLSSISINDAIIIYQGCAKYNLLSFYHDMHTFGSLLLAKIQTIADNKDKIQTLEELFFNCQDVILQNELINLWLSVIVKEYGPDDNTENYFNTFKKIIDRILTKAASRDHEKILSLLANHIMAQKKISEYIGIKLVPEKYLSFEKEIKNNQKDFIISGLGSATRFLAEAKDSQKATLDFISKPITDQTATTFAIFLIKTKRAKKLLKYLQNDHNDINQLNEIEKVNYLKAKLYLFYHSFWDRPLTERAVLIDYLVIPASVVLTEKDISEAYQDTFNYAADALFPEHHRPNSDDELAVSFLKAYLNTANKYTRSLLLAGMLVVSNETTERNQTLSTGKKLALLCEHMGPAYIKLAQAIHSHPATSEAVRNDLAHVKGHANPPPRWDLWRLMQEVLPTETLSQIKYVGKLLGSASYNLALEVELQTGEQVVLILLREHAARDTAEGFEHLKATINACTHPRALTFKDSLSSMLEEAQTLSKAEMDHTISTQQIKQAQEMYHSSLDININKTHYVVTMRPIQVIESGPGYRLIDRMHGIEFNDLPNQTAEEQEIKKAIAIAVVTTELTHILQGRAFDSDRHGNQLRAMIDKENKTIHLGLYDFGEMSLVPPTLHEIALLAGVFQELLHPLNLLNNNEGIDAALARQINRCVTNDTSGAHYLMRVRRSLLALRDFHQLLNQEDILNILASIMQNNPPHPLIQRVLTIPTNLYSQAQTLKRKAQAISTNLIKDSLNTSSPLKKLKMSPLYPIDVTGGINQGRALFKFFSQKLLSNQKNSECDNLTTQIRDKKFR